MDKKFIYIAIGGFVLLVLVLILAVSCSNKNTKSKASQTLTFWSTEDEKAAFEPLINNFRQTHPGVKINYITKDSAEYLTDSLNEIAAGKGPDVWAIPNSWLPKYSDKLVAMPDKQIASKDKDNAEVYKDTFPSSVYNDNVINNQVYGIPLSIDTLQLFYNTELMYAALQDYQKNHPNDDTSAIGTLLNEGPKNWDEFVQISRLLTKKNGTEITQSAIPLGSSEVVNANDILTCLMLQDGAVMTSPDNTTAQFHTAQNEFGGQPYPGTRALDFFTSFANPNSENYTWNSNISDPMHAFANGKSAMMIGYDKQQSDIKRINPKINFQKIALPQIKETAHPVNYASYTTYVVTKASKNPTLAWSFVASLMDTSNSSQYLNQTKKPPVLLNTIGNSEDYLAVQAKTAKTWFNPDPQKVSDIFKTMIDQTVGGGNAQTAIENAASQVTTLLGKLKE